MVDFKKLESSLKAHFKLVAFVFILIAVAFLFTQKSVSIVVEDRSVNDLSSSSNVVVTPVNYSPAEEKGVVEEQSNQDASGQMCVSDSDCDDGIECTVDYCEQGVCRSDLNLFGDCVTDSGSPGVCNEMGICVVPESVCDNGLDDDMDGFIDCEDPDCEGLACVSGNVTGVCSMQQCVA